MAAGGHEEHGLSHVEESEAVMGWQLEPGGAGVPRMTQCSWRQPAGRQGGGNGIRPLGLLVGEEFLYVGHLGCAMLGRAPVSCTGRPSCMVGPPSLCRAVPSPTGLGQGPERASCRHDPENLVSDRACVGPKKAGFVPARVTRPTLPGIATTMKE
jgi:hypothetical protein